ncbi:hypothetical protein B0T18DRAFT_131459 [Schizothecium vesticola]|uniref:Uncharacterized protein n=1 Tax=Schizothecium vesticola TaxID=314040 RepID=A0AA40K9S7_9PEZI|nr:hypothetical protein B0T18DRAFT_131459 [Schizothecium vesticola]
MNNISSNNAEPIQRILLETLMYIGLSAEKAAEIWDEWTNWPDFGDGINPESDPDKGDDFVMPFIEFIIGHTIKSGRVRDATGDSDTEWRNCMDACGISVEAQEAIMDPHFTYLCRSNSCIHWARDTINIRYDVVDGVCSTEQRGHDQKDAPVAP